VLVTTADHALLTPAMVEEFTAAAGDADVAVGVVERRNLLGAYPGNRRTWLKFRGGAYSGANLFALTGDRARAALRLWATVEQDRKKGWKLVAAFGPLLLVRALTRSITLEAGLAAAGRRLGLAARAVVLSQPEAAIDVDKPADHALAERILTARG
jgi:GTP:adenosylcobinamide-phosphate guanylyltransferase